MAIEQLILFVISCSSKHVLSNRRASNILCVLHCAPAMMNALLELVCNGNNGVTNGHAFGFIGVLR